MSFTRSNFIPCCFSLLIKVFCEIHLVGFQGKLIKKASLVSAPISTFKPIKNFPPARAASVSCVCVLPDQGRSKPLKICPAGPFLSAGQRFAKIWAKSLV